MKRSIRAAAVLCAVAVALSVLLAGCGNDEEEGNGSGGLGGHVGTNPFKGLTIVHEGQYESETVAFTSDTKGAWTYSDEYYSEDFDFEYAVDSTKGLLKLRRTTYTSVGVSSAPDGAESDTTGPMSPTVTVKTEKIDAHIEKAYGNLDKETKSLIYDAMANAYRHYKFSADGKTVEMDSSYYFGNMAESGASFYAPGNSFDFGRRMWLDIKRDDGWYEYEGFPKFSGNTFTAVIFAVDYDRETDTENHRKLSAALIGTYQISGTGTNCTGTVTFTQLPDEFKGAFEVNTPYTIKQYTDEYTTTYTVKN